MFKWVGKGANKLAKGASRKAAVPLMQSLYLFIRDLIQAMLRKKTGTAETFEQAVERYQLTEEDLQDRKKMFRIQLIVYILGSISVAAYTFYLMRSDHWMSALIAFTLLMYLVISALKSHFWIFQIKHRKLGCTIQEWLNASIKE